MIKQYTQLRVTFVSALLLALTACSKESTDTSVANVPAEISDTSAVLAKVNGEAITQDDVDFMINRTFSGADQLFFDEKMQSKVLDSLIASMAMKQAMLETLDQDALAEIDDRANAYKEELYVKEYLVQNASPEPVSRQMVTDYYQQYPEEFGGGEERVFEMLSTATKPNEGQRDAILKAAHSIQKNINWATFAKQSSYELRYQTSTMRSGLFASQVEAAVKKGGVNEASNVIFIDGIPHFIRVMKINTLAAKPINQVSAQIRKKLAAIQLKKAVKNASKVAMSQAKVVKL